MPIEIFTQDWNSQSLEAELDDEIYYIILDWNQSGGYWEFGIRNSAYRTLLDGVSLVPNYPLNRQFCYPELPPGMLVVDAIYNGGAIPRDGFTSGKYHLVYFTRLEVIEMNADAAIRQTV